ncbi:MAG: anthranilate phosphoribosyltransferase, partial [Chloroflexi bacterium]|nr:anthranilate phosphoribosyltransferase [Chloroflexota bacterium]
SPEALGFERAPRSSIGVSSVQESVRLLNGVLDGERGPARDIVLMNAAAALLAADRVASLKDGVALAAESIDSGRARQKLDALVKLSQSLE